MILTEPVGSGASAAVAEVRPLRDHLRVFLEDWRADLSPSWATFFGDAEPDFDAILPDLISDPQFPVLPGRRNRPSPQAPRGSHIFRALDGIEPAEVSVVLIGQDPYPRLDRATGRAFEDGALQNWGGNVAISLQRLLQSALSLRHGRSDFARGPGDWRTVQAAIQNGEVPMEPPSAYFDRLQTEHGVLFVNAGWTLTRFEPGGGAEQECHIAMWRPLMTRLLHGLAAEANRPVVFLLLGNFARNLFKSSGAEKRAREAGRWDTRARAVNHPHPNAPGPQGYFGHPNPLEGVNQALTEMGGPAVPW